MKGKNVKGMKVSWKGQTWKIVDVERETDKAILAKVRPVMGLTDEEDQKRWEEERMREIRRAKRHLELHSGRLSEKQKQRISENIMRLERALREGWSQKMWIPLSVIRR